MEVHRQKCRQVWARVLAGLSKPLCVGQVVVLIQGVERHLNRQHAVGSGIRPVGKRRLDGLEVNVDRGAGDA